MLRKLEGSLSAQEEMLFQEVLKQNEQLNKEWLALEQAWNLSASVTDQIDFQPDLPAAWSKITHQVESRRKSERRPFRAYPWIAAASVLLFLFVGGWYFWPEPARQPMRVMVSAGAEAQYHELPDGSSVKLEAFSTLEYQHFDDQSRMVALSGTGFFEVKKDPDRPFTVTTQHADVQVLGTSFLVQQDSQSNELSVSVLTGKVSVEIGKSGGKRAEIFLLPGQRQRYKSTTGELSHDTFSVSSLQNLVNGQMTFVNKPLKAVLDQLKLQYGVNFTLEHVDLEQCLFSGSFEGLSLQEACQLLEISLELNISNSGHSQLTVQGKGCKPPDMIN